MCFLKKYSMAYSYVIILSISILAFIIPCKEWNFVGESYSSIYGIAKYKNLNPFNKNSFSESLSDLNSNVVNVPTQPKNTTFFEALYRPVVLFAYLIEYKLFGLNAYFYYLLIVLIHIMNSFLLFYLLRSLFSGLIALFCTLFFTINPYLFVWFGEISRQQNHISLLFFLLSMFFLKKLLTRKVIKTNLFLIFIAGLFYLLCILTRETFIVAPFLIILAIPFVYKQTHILKKILFALFMLLSVVLIYFIMKLISYPIKINSITPVTQGYFYFFEKLIFNISGYIVEFAKNLYLIFISMFFYHKICFFCEANHLIFLYKIIKDFLILALAVLFILNTQKKMIIYFLVCFLLVSWPFFFIKATASVNVFCYFYEALPFASAALGSLLYYNSYKETKIFRIIFYTYATFFIVSNTAGMIIYQNMYSTVGKKLKDGIKKLKIENYETLKNRLFLIANVKNIPGSVFGMPHAFQLYFMENQRPKAVLLSMEIHSSNQDLTKYLDVNFDDNGSKITLQSRNKDLLWFELNNLQSTDLNGCVEKFEVNSNVEQKICNLIIFLKKPLATPDKALIIWDDAVNKFHVIK